MESNKRSAPKDALFGGICLLEQKTDLFHDLVERALGDALRSLGALCHAFAEICLVVYDAVEVLAHGGEFFYIGFAVFFFIFL